MQKFRLKRPPALTLRCRGLLYSITGLLAAVSIKFAINPPYAMWLSVICYTLAAGFTLIAGYYIALDIKFVIQWGKQSLMCNAYIGKVFGDYRLKTVVFAVPGAFSNVLFACFHGVMGVLYQSAWFGTLAAYYILLSILRIHVLWQERKLAQKCPSKRMRQEITMYLRSSILFILLAIVLGGMVILLVLSDSTGSYPGLTIYAVATYVFYKLAISTVHMVRVAKLHSPLLTIVRKINYIDALVSLLILQTALIFAFGDGTLSAQIMNGITGTVVSLLILGMGLQGVGTAKSMKKLLS